MITKNLSTLEINNLSAKQYSREKLAENLKDSALYLVPEASAIPQSSYFFGAVYDENGNGQPLIEYDTGYSPCFDTFEQVIYVPAPDNLVLNGEKFFFGNQTSSYGIVEITYLKDGIWTSLSDIADGRCIEKDQTLVLLVKGSGELDKFEYVRLLNLPPAPIKIDQSPIVEVCNTEYLDVSVASDTIVKYTNIIMDINSRLYALTKTTEERVVYISLLSGLVLDGNAVSIAVAGDTDACQNNYMQYVHQRGNDITTSVNWITDGRGFNPGQTLILYVKGSGTSGKFDHVRLLNLPYPAAESASF